MTLRTDFLLDMATFPKADLSVLLPYYARMPLDPYINGTFRRRRFSHFAGPATALRRLPHKYFLQSKVVNHLAGGIQREFEELEDGFMEQPAMQAMVSSFHNFLGIDPQTTELGVHQIRIICCAEFSGAPAPEGIHKDGFDYIGIFCVDRHQILGATTHVYTDKDEPPIFSRQLAPGEVVFASDRKVYHFAEPVFPSTAQPGYWDLIVITA